MRAFVLCMLLFSSCLAPMTSDDVWTLAPNGACGTCAADQVCDAATRSCVQSATLSGGVVSDCTHQGLSARVTIGGFSTCSLNGKAYFKLDGLVPGGPQRLAVGRQDYEAASQDVTLEPGFNTLPDIRLTPVGGCGSTHLEVDCSCTATNCQ